MMKKMFFLMILLLLFPLQCFANEQYEVSLDKCVDGDTAWFILDGERIKTRFLAIDTPESVHPTKGVEPFGKEASTYTCESLTNAKEITIEYDEASERVDKYERHLVWVYVDHNLLQELILQKGYAQVAYLYGDYQYVDRLQKVQEEAKDSGIGIWSEEAKLEETTEETVKVQNQEDEEETDRFFSQIMNKICEILEKLLQYIVKLVQDMI